MLGKARTTGWLPPSRMPESESARVDRPELQLLPVTQSDSGFAHHVAVTLAQMYSAFPTFVAGSQFHVSPLVLCGALVIGVGLPGRVKLQAGELNRQAPLTLGPGGLQSCRSGSPETSQRQPRRQL